MIIRRISVFILLAATIVRAADGAVIIDHSIALEGSDRGDSIKVTALLDPGESSAVLDVQPFAKLEQDDGPARPVISRINGHETLTARTALSREELKTNIAAPAIVSATVTIPFSRFDLPPGDYQLGYELRLLVRDKVVFVKPTGVSLLTIAEPQPGKMRSIGYTVIKPVYETKIGKGYALKDGKLRQFDWPYTVSHTVPEQRQKSVPDDGFSRGRDEKDFTFVTAPLSSFLSANQRMVYFATNRQLSNSTDELHLHFGNAPARRVTYGASVVNIPVSSDIIGKVETQGRFFWSKKDPGTYFSVESTRKILTRAFRDTMSDDVLLFIHGYFNSFESAVLRAAQLKHDIAFSGDMMSFVWPSVGSMDAYAVDEARCNESVWALEEALTTLTNGLNKRGKIHVIAHSMGNRLLLKTIRAMALQGKTRAGDKPFGKVMLAAPDVAPTDFAMQVPDLIKRSDTVTFYFADNDIALSGSRVKHIDMPIGLRFFYADGMHTIDASRANQSLENFRHAYFAESDKVIIDLRLNILWSLSPDSRKPPLGGRRYHEGFAYWDFDANTPGSVPVVQPPIPAPAPPAPE